MSEALRKPVRADAAEAAATPDYWIAPTPDDAALTETVSGIDHTGAAREIRVVVERPMTLFLNRQEIVTTMTIGDHPAYLAVGFLVNQNMLGPEDEILSVDVDDDVGAVIVRTARETDYEEKLKKRVRTSGCAQGTVFGDVMDKFDSLSLPGDAVIKTSWIYALSKAINLTPSLYLEAGAIHGCVLCREDAPLVYMEDVGRHNAIDKVAGYMFMNDAPAAEKIFYTTGRLTSEMVIKTAQMGVPILISRSGFTAWGVELARRVGLTLIGRARGKRFIALSGHERILFDADPSAEPEEDGRRHRKGALGDGP
ncbi:MAG: formate dehydrogenase accessory sulfurtransferase FdhD [Alphaproteobacteria bacterium]|nr:formate dehydrogenase accessory sulfurtransferase FdhD [Alphaproteobacteria bacterium]